MTDINDEQRAALARIDRDLEAGARFVRVEDFVALISALPPELTNPQPVLPTEPGTTIYGGTDQPRVLFRLIGLSDHRPWIDAWSQQYNDEDARELMGEWDETPPSAPERPQITREQVIAVFDSYGDDYDIETVDDLVELANGTDRD